MRRTGWLAALVLALGFGFCAWSIFHGSPGYDAGAAVGIVLNFHRLEEIAFVEDIPLASMVPSLREAGVDGWVVGERNLGQLARLGRVDVVRGTEWIARLRLRGKEIPPGLDPSVVYLHFRDERLANWAMRRLAAVWPYGTTGRISLEEGDWYGVRAPFGAHPADALREPGEPDPRLAPPPLLMGWPLGVDPQDLATVASWDMGVVVELGNGPVGPWASRQDPAELPKTAPVDLILFAKGDLGTRDPHHVARVLRERGWNLGVAWQQTTPALREAAKSIPHALVKVHPMFPGERTTDIVSGLVERRERLIYYTGFETFEETSRFTTAPAYLASVRTVLDGVGFARGLPQPLRGTPASAPAKGAALAAVSAAFFLAIRRVFPPAAIPALAVWGAGLVAAGGVGARIFTPTDRLWDVAAFLAAVTFPVLAIGAARVAANRVGRVTARTSPSWSGWTAGMAAVGIATCLSMVGGMILQVLLGEVEYIAQVNQFRGVKAALVLPSVGWAAAAAWENRGWIRARMREWGGRLLRGQVAVLAVGIPLLALLLLRSGNFPAIPIPGVEIEARIWLDQMLGARPRWKEFLFGHPLLWGMAAGCAWERNDGTSSCTRWLFLAPLAAVGQASVLNTFAHLHTSLDLSLLRTVHGIWLGWAVSASMSAAWGLWLRGGGRLRARQG